MMAKSGTSNYFLASRDIRNKFDKKLVKQGQSFWTPDSWQYVRGDGTYTRPYITFVTWWMGDPIFQFWHREKFSGGMTEDFGIFFTDDLWRAPEHDIKEEFLKIE